MRWEQTRDGWSISTDNLTVSIFHDPESTWWYQCRQVDDEDHPLIAISQAAAQREAVRHVHTHIRRMFLQAEKMNAVYGRARSVKEALEK